VLRPADCGGPLLDLDGKMVGINIARAGRVNSYAIPTAAIKPLLEELKSGNLAPEVIAKKKLESLGARLAQLQTSEGALAKKVAQLEETHRQAAEAEANAKKASTPDPDMLSKLHSETFAAENGLKQARAELLKVRAEVKRSEAEKVTVEKSVSKE
jgi:hypothetical protein